MTRSSSTQATREGAKPKESCLRRWSAIAFLLTQPRDDQTIYTTKYLGAAHEIFVWSLLICWTVSLIFTPEMVFNHPAREATWHFNPCFGWDFPPASYIAVILNSTNVYWTWRYAWLETTRSAMLPETDGDMALLGRRIPVFGNTGRRALGKVGPEFQYKELEVVDGYLMDESSLHESAKGKLVWKDGGYFHDEFGRTGLFSSGVGSAGDPLGHSYQYGERICDYYLDALELPKPSDLKK